jgi:hypothetical protein
MTDLASNPWVIVIGLTAAVVAAATPLIQAVRARKRFRFHVAGLFDGASANSGALMVILSGTVINPGRSPLVPGTFDLEAVIRGDSYRFDRLLIPPDLTFAEGHWLEGPLAQHDLARYASSFRDGEPVRGHLMFGSTELSVEQWRAARDNKTLRLILSCTDEDRWVHRAYLQLDLTLGGESGGFDFARHGFRAHFRRRQ